ncbi:hypothetical protein AAHA92_22463 [Salvia divinorum]|uniref:Uncharacterized protein n=1 Tax=Salvia divinorum TaxID=28513 RepID=A0ABD1GRN8_SALDI
MKKPMDVENLHSVDIIAPLVQEYLEDELLQEKFEGAGRTEEMEKEVAWWCKDVQTQANPEKKELKTLPPGLKYSYLGENETLPVIVSSKLTEG